MIEFGVDGFHGGVVFDLLPSVLGLGCGFGGGFVSELEAFEDELSVAGGFVGAELLEVSDGAVASANRLEWPEFDLAPGAKATRTFSVLACIDACGTDTFSSAVEVDIYDPDDFPANNYASVSVSGPRQRPAGSYGVCGTGICGAGAANVLLMIMALGLLRTSGCCSRRRTIGRRTSACARRYPAGT